MLSKYNLYTNLGGNFVPKRNMLSQTDLVLWLMFLSDGDKTVDQISNYLKVRKEKIIQLYKLLSKKKLVKKI